ncbi:MAG: ANTAR domain-containing protein [Oscillospiraceae bacterium]|nr:ANTAR domain-containing protein [Oscillospiraceae bacterium]
MVFQSDTYSVLLVSASEKLNTAMASVLPPTDFWPVQTARSISQARRLTLEKPFDLILVNSPLPDGVGVPFCIDVCANSESGVLLLVRSEDYEETYYRVLPHGVMTLAKPVSREILSQSLRLLCAVRERLRSVGKAQSTVEEKMEELRLVNRAKWLLMERQGLQEDEAHRTILRRAMEQRISKKEAAEQILRSSPKERRTETE